MIGIKRIDHINMRVKNLAQSIEFYRKNFGFEMREDHHDAEEPWAIIGIPNTAYLCLYEHPDKERSDEVLRISHFGLAVDEFDAVMDKLKASGTKILYNGPVVWDHSRSIYIEDPSGHEIELSEKIGGGLN